MQRRISRWGGFFAVTFVLGLGISVGSMPSPLYPLYQSAWQIPPSALSYIFTAYMAGVIVSLLCLGRLSEVFGRFRIIVSALVLICMGLLISALAGEVATLIGARALIGLGNGLLTTAGAMALVDVHPSHDKRIASFTTSLSITAGFGLGTAFSGALAQLGFAPLVLPYLVMLILALAGLALVVRTCSSLPRPLAIRPRISIWPRMALPAGPKRPLFLLAGATGLMTFAVGSLFGSMVPPLLQTVLPWKGPAVIGVAFLFMVAISIVTQLTQRGIPVFKGLAYGMFAFVGALGTLALGLLTESVAALIASIMFTGLGQGLGFMESAILAGQSADENRRAANMSTYFFLSYLGATVPIIAVGLLADQLGLIPAVLVFCAIAACALTALGLQALKLARKA